MRSVSQRIRYYRKKRGLTQMEVAAALGIRTDNYAKYESGARTPRDDRLIKLSKILKVSYDALNEGIESEFLGLLSRHAIGSVLGEAGSFTAFNSDMELSGEAYYAVSEFFNRSDYAFAINNTLFYQRYLARPNLAGIIGLYDLYRDQCDSDSAADHVGDLPLTVRHQHNSLDAVTTTKLAFCVAVKKYLEHNDTVTILDDAERLAGSILECFDALQFFAVRVFVPFLSLIIDAVELCMNTNIDDFEIAFLFYALTPPDDDSDEDD